MSWHDQPFSEALTRFGTRVEQGLDENGARQRLARYGPNRLPEPKRAGPLARFARQFHNVLIYVLMAAATTPAAAGAPMLMMVVSQAICGSVIGRFGTEVPLLLDLVRDDLFAAFDGLSSAQSRIPLYSTVTGAWSDQRSS